MPRHIVNYSKTEHDECIAESLESIHRRKKNGWQVEDIDGKIPVGFCELCGLPFFEGDEYEQDVDGICTCVECPEKPEPPALLPCPFCGGEAHYGTSTTRSGDDNPETMYRVNCISCGGHMAGIFGGYVSKEAAAERWNVRTTNGG